MGIVNKILRRGPQPLAPPAPGVRNSSQAFDERISRKRSQVLESLQMSPGQVRAIMTSQLETVTPDTPMRIVLETMATAGTRHVAVCDGYRNLVGIISDRDLNRRQGELARDVMTRGPLVVHESASLKEVVDLMVEHHISCVPVLQGKMLTGIVTRTDVLVVLQRLLEAFSGEPADEEPALVN
jgi:acetoin utilization protein AcuB